MASADFYDDTEFSYVEYWNQRQYEHLSEEMAVKRLLGKMTFAVSADIGGGFGRLTKLLTNYSKKTYLIEPSEKMRLTAKDYLKNVQGIQIKAGTATETTLSNKSIDLFSSFRVMHHIPDVNSVFTEIKRVVKPNGFLLLEFANSANFKSSLRSFISGKPLMFTPVEMRSQTNIKNKTISFVNHHPKAMLKLVSNSGFQVLKIYSVSNFRYEFIKKIVPVSLLLILEYIAQPLLSSFYFGPSIFILARRFDK